MKKEVPEHIVKELAPLLIKIAQRVLADRQKAG